MTEDTMRRQPIKTPNMRKVEQVGCSITFQLNVKFSLFRPNAFNLNVSPHYLPAA